MISGDKIPSPNSALRMNEAQVHEWQALLSAHDWSQETDLWARDRLRASELDAELVALDEDYVSGRITRREWSLAREPIISRIAVARECGG